VPLVSFEFPHSLLSLFVQHLSQGNTNTPTLQAEVTQAREVAAAVEAPHVMVKLAVETSAQEATAAWDSIMIRVKDAEDRATLAEREVQETVSRVEAENAAMIASSCEDAEGLVWKIILLEGELVEARRGSRGGRGEFSWLVLHDGQF
jgi:DNA topoisomerase IA